MTSISDSQPLKKIKIETPAFDFNQENLIQNAKEILLVKLNQSYFFTQFTLDQIHLLYKRIGYLHFRAEGAVDHEFAYSKKDGIWKFDFETIEFSDDQKTFILEILKNKFIISDNFNISINHVLLNAKTLQPFSIPEDFPHMRLAYEVTVSYVKFYCTPDFKLLRFQNEYEILETSKFLDSLKASAVETLKKFAPLIVYDPEKMDFKIDKIYPSELKKGIIGYEVLFKNGIKCEKYQDKDFEYPKKLVILAKEIFEKISSSYCVLLEELIIEESYHKYDSFNERWVYDITFRSIHNKSSKHCRVTLDGSFLQKIEEVPC